MLGHSTRLRMLAVVAVAAMLSSTGHAIDPFYARQVRDAVEKNQTDIVTRELKRGALQRGLTYDHGDTLLHVAARRGRASMISLLAGHGASTARRNEQGDTAVHCAAAAGHVATLAALAAAATAQPAAPPLATLLNERNLRGRTALHVASAAQHVGAVQWLLDQGADPRSTDAAGNTPLHCATASTARTAPAETIAALVARGAPRDALNSAGLAPLHLAVQGGDYPAIQALLDLGAPVDTPDGSQRTPLSHACATGRVLVVELLLGRGASATAPDSAGDAPLHVAARAGDLRVVRALVARGAALDARNRAGQTPWDVAPPGPEHAALRDALRPPFSLRSLFARKA